MSNGFTIEVKGLDELMLVAEKYPNISEKHINKAINRSLIRIQDQAKKNAPSGDSQQLRQNWKITMGRFAGSLQSGAKNGGYSYGLAIEFGTRPHYIPVKNNPMFQLWATRRGLNPYAVSKSISKKGTKAKPFFQPSIDSQKSKIDEEFNKAMDNLMKEL
jgi:HK97 gp10 family phage protein